MTTIELEGAARTFDVDVSNERFETKTLHFIDQSIAGRELIEALGYHPAETFVVLRYRPDGALEEVGLEAHVDLGEPRENSFFVNLASEMANLVIDGVRLTWTQRTVTGATLKHLARLNADDVDIFLESDEAAPVLVGDDQEVRLDKPGLERFISKPARDVLITVNEKPVHIRRGRHTGAQIKAAAIAQGVNIKPSFTLSEDKPGGKIIGDNDPVQIKGGEAFLAIDDHDDS